jgi:hypothetical protein
MGLFISSAVAFGVVTMVLMLFLGLWTYKDALVMSDQSPALWVLVVLLVPNFLGLVVYLLVGRTKKQHPAPGSFKKPLIAFAILTALAFVVFIGSAINFSMTEGGFGGNRTARYVSGTMVDAFGNARRGTFFSLNASHRNQEWNLSVGRGNGTIQISPRLSEAELAQIYVAGNASRGEVFLQLEQDGRVAEFHVTEFGGILDVTGFAPGRIRMIASLENAEDVRLVVSWHGE